MTPDNAFTIEAQEKLRQLVSSEEYQNNLHFWERAWNMVKAPYTQMPDLPYLEKIPPLLKNVQTQTVLDLGCGSGWLSIFLARRGFVVTGVDISTHAIELAKTWATAEKLAIDFKALDIADISFPDGSFDAVVANSIFEHFTYDMAKITLSRLRHMLVPDGQFIGCFDKVGGGPGEYYELSDRTHVYTDKARRGMLLRYFSNEELRSLFEDWKVSIFEELPNGSRFVCAHNK